MSPSLLARIAEFLPLLPAGLALLAGAWGIRRLLRDPTRARPDRRAALAIAAIVALVIGAVVTSFIAAFGGAWGADPQLEGYARALPYGLAAMGLTFLASIGGYAILARPAIGGAALAGALLGPALLVGAQLGATQLSYLLSNAAYEAQTGLDATETGDRSKILHLEISQVNATYTPDGKFVASVRLRATIHADTDVTLEAGKISWPRFTLLPEGGAILDAEAPAGSPMTLAAGSDTNYDLTFRTPSELLNAMPGSVQLVSTYGPPTPGPWVLRVTLTDASGAGYLLETEVQVDADH
jgi:hypothetical protein